MKFSPAAAIIAFSAQSPSSPAVVMAGSGKTGKIPSSSNGKKLSKVFKSKSKALIKTSASNSYSYSSSMSIDIDTDPPTSRPTGDSELSAKVRAHLSKLTVLSDGSPNARVTCTAGIGEAADYIVGEMERIGLLPLGDMEGTSYFNIVPNSIHEQFCPQGMRNIIGMIPGSDPALNDEYVIFSAHYDGPNNENPQTETTRGNQDTTNTFDDALAVAFGLGLAEEMMLKNPPKRNVIFLFDDVEEGWNSVLTSDGEVWRYWCYVEDGKSYFNSVMLSKPGFEGYTQQGSCNYAVQVGFGSWLREPTVDISKVKLIFNIDPLGIPRGVSPEDLVLAVLNGETSTGIDSQGSSVSLNDIIDEALPEQPVSYVKFPRAVVVGNTNSADALTSPKTYEPLCEAGNNCRDDGGIPNIWLAALSFQPYHGGTMINRVKQLFQQFSTQGLYQDENLPDTAYFSIDKVDAGNFEAKALNALTTSLSAFINNLFAREELSSLTFNKDNPPDDTYKYNKEDLANLKNSMMFLSKRIDAIAPELDFYKVAQGLVITQLKILEAVPPEISIFQESIKTLALTSVALHLSLDTFNKQYTEKEAFLDQTVSNLVVAEPAN